MTTEARTRAAPSPSRQAIPRNDRHHALQWLCAERVRRAQDLLENTDDTIERIATLCGSDPHTRCVRTSRGSTT
jgi:AraC-like DNA-binding protein